MRGDSPKKVLLDRWNAEPFRKKLLHRWWYPQRENEVYGAVLALEAPPVVVLALGDPSKRPANKDAREEQKRRASARKGKGSKRKHDGLAKAPSSGDGGGGGAAPPPSSASRAPSALSSLQQPGAPPRAADEDTDGAPVYGDTSEDGNVKELLSVLVQKHSNDHIIAEKIKILSQRYTHFRRIREDGSCFYRAFLFSYLENLGQLEDSLAEATRLMEHVAKSKDSLCGLELDKAYF